MLSVLVSTVNEAEKLVQQATALTNFMVLSDGNGVLLEDVGRTLEYQSELERWENEGGKS